MHFKNNKVSPLKKEKLKAQCPYHSRVSTINTEAGSNIKSHKNCTVYVLATRNALFHDACTQQVSQFSPKMGGMHKNKQWIGFVLTNERFRSKTSKASQKHSS